MLANVGGMAGVVKVDSKLQSTEFTMKGLRIKNTIEVVNDGGAKGKVSLSEKVCILCDVWIPLTVQFADKWDKGKEMAPLNTRKGIALVGFHLDLLIIIWRKILYFMEGKKWALPTCPTMLLSLGWL